MTSITDLHKKWLRDADYSKEYDALNEEFETVSRWVPAINTGMTPVGSAPSIDASHRGHPVAHPRDPAQDPGPQGMTLSLFANKIWNWTSSSVRSRKPNQRVNC